MTTKPVEENKKITSDAMTAAFSEADEIRARFLSLNDSFKNLTADNVERRMMLFQAEMLMQIACSLKNIEFQAKRMGLVNWELAALHASIYFQQHED